MTTETKTKQANANQEPCQGFVKMARKNIIDAANQIDGGSLWQYDDNCRHAIAEDLDKIVAAYQKNPNLIAIFAEKIKLSFNHLPGETTINDLLRYAVAADIRM